MVLVMALEMLILPIVNESYCSSNDFLFSIIYVSPDYLKHGKDCCYLSIEIYFSIIKTTTGCTFLYYYVYIRFI